MHLATGWQSIAEMGYAMSRLEIEPESCEEEKSLDEVGNSQGPKELPRCLDHEIAHLTNLKSRPHEHLIRDFPGRRALSVSTVKMLAGRECNYSGRGRFSSADCCHMLSRCVPGNGPLLMDQMTSRAYVSQFSADGSLFVAGFQGGHIRIYNVDKGWKCQKNILAKSLRWTITDTSLSPDQRYLVYASMSPIVHIVDVSSAAVDSLANVTEIHEGLNFSADNGPYSFGIFCVKFSTDGRELIAGSSDDSIYVYDLVANKLSLRIPAHESDVNTVCFSDGSGHIIYSGSDDTYCKVWDRRCLSARNKPAGVLMGHLEGITFIDSRGDGRYFISNGKDQTIKLWDIRKMDSNTTCRPGYRNYEWDYRWMDYPPQARDLKHPFDRSVATYKGHSVLRTLIRCYFSPEHSTGQKYIYTGSYDSCVYIYDVVTGAQVAALKHHKSPVRDCSWHPDYPTIVSSSWDGDIVKWEFLGNGEIEIPVMKKRIRKRHVH
ncbi:LEC14B protein [Rhodamnia argentea]|uniref:LEC14B homolog n=1 Tax=Rhodamnia argentea TaxID=178133 RepID=A0A8B8PD02_9MYRT|nr:LEC14B protein [Rhodamnia argentea]XP_030532706.2 LEC14B protein [Rhodamnia argentea]XP_030532707.2 LEC14B protein [Rhodamnia argentea]